MSELSDTKLEVLSSHYDETFSNIKAALRQRDRLFVLLLVIVTVMLLQAIAPEEAGTTLSEMVGTRLGVGPIDVSVISSVLWFSALAAVVRYFQAVVYAERQYEYIHRLEEVLSSHFDDKAFTREGRAYLDGYPLFSKWTWVLYTIAFPGLLVAVLGGKLITETCGASFGLQIAFDSLAFVLITISTALYLVLVHLHR